MATIATGGPSVTRDRDEALRDLRAHGACVIADALDADLLAEARTALYRAADTDRRYGLRDDYA